MAHTDAGRRSGTSIEQRAADTPDAPFVIDEHERIAHVRRVPRRVRPGRGRARRARASARATTSRGSCRPGSRRWCSSAGWPGSARCRTRCCRSTASARSASSRSRPGAKLLIVPSVWRGFDFEAMARTIAAATPRSRGARLRQEPARRRPVDAAARPRPVRPSRSSPASRPTVRCAGSSTRPARPRTRRARATPTRPSAASAYAMDLVLDLTRRGPQRDGVPVHPHRRHRLADRRADGRLRARDRRGLRPGHDDPGARARAGDDRRRGHRRSTWRTSTAQRAEPTTRSSRTRAIFVGGGAAKPPAAPLRGEGAARRASGILSAATASPSARSSRWPASTTPTRSSPTPRAALCAGIDVKVVKLDGTVVGPGEEGEIRAKGPNLMPRLRRPVARRRRLRRGGLLPHRRPRHLDDDGFIVDHRPAEGRDHPQGREHLGQGGRGPALHLARRSPTRR